jgi:hypothetical protein
MPTYILLLDPKASISFTSTILGVWTRITSERTWPYYKQQENKEGKYREN